MNLIRYERNKEVTQIFAILVRRLSWRRSVFQAGPPRRGYSLRAFRGLDQRLDLGRRVSHESASELVRGQETSLFKTDHHRRAASKNSRDIQPGIEGLGLLFFLERRALPRWPVGICYFRFQLVVKIRTPVR